MQQCKLYGTIITGISFLLYNGNKQAFIDWAYGPSVIYSPRHVHLSCSLSICDNTSVTWPCFCDITFFVLNSAGTLLPGADGRNVSLSVDCGTIPGSAELYWSNGGLPSVLLNVEYACFSPNDTSQVGASMHGAYSSNVHVADSVAVAGFTVR